MRGLRGRAWGLSWNRTVWCRVATVRPLRFTLRERESLVGSKQGTEMI